MCSLPPPPLFSLSFLPLGSKFPRQELQVWECCPGTDLFLLGAEAPGYKGPVIIQCGERVMETCANGLLAACGLCRGRELGLGKGIDYHMGKGFQQVSPA